MDASIGGAVSLPRFGWGRSFLSGICGRGLVDKVVGGAANETYTSNSSVHLERSDQTESRSHLER